MVSSVPRPHAGSVASVPLTSTYPPTGARARQAFKGGPVPDDITPQWEYPTERRTPLEHLEHLQAFLVRTRRTRPMTRHELSEADREYEIACLREEARNYRALWLATLDMIAEQQKRVAEAES